jgi:glycosyltransferase involved in cell wall biosynthesis
VVPCYNEAERLATEQFRSFAVQYPEVQFLFVNDGSQDRTAELLAGLSAADPRQFTWLDLTRNGGKAEAVRRGMMQACNDGTRYIGYWDADLATPLREIPRFIDALERGHDMCFGSRVRLLGRAIDRHPLRHYLGRMFATAASVVLDLAIYDTQCGAKLFRTSEVTRALFSERFCVNWTFDVEIIARLQSILVRSGNQGDASKRIYELPLDEWRDVAGSKVRPTDFVRGLLELVRIYQRYGRGGRRQRVSVAA